MISLNRVKMNVIETSSDGVVNQDTLFLFHQEGTHVFAEYFGGKIVKGFLVGNLMSNRLTFTYCQLQYDGTLDNGKSHAELEFRNGKLRLVEHFEWASRPGKKGVNIFEEVIE